MKLFLYLILFLAILGVTGFGFFSITTPTIPQTTITKEIAHKEAFGNTEDTLTPAPMVTAPAATAPSAPIPQE